MTRDTGAQACLGVMVSSGSTVLGHAVIVPCNHSVAEEAV